MSVTYHTHDRVRVTGSLLGGEVDFEGTVTQVVPDRKGGLTLILWAAVEGVRTLRTVAPPPPDPED